MKIFKFELTPIVIKVIPNRSHKIGIYHNFTKIPGSLTAN